jgi:peptidyl-prolyl cis-trans isomerase C
VAAEKIPPIAADSAFVKPYLEALFSLRAPGVVAQPVRTIYGWHAVRVTEVLAAETVPYEKAEQSLREELLLSRRQERVQRLIERLRADYGVQIPDNVGQTLARVEL